MILLKVSPSQQKNSGSLGGGFADFEAGFQIDVVIRDRVEHHVSQHVERLLGSFEHILGELRDGRGDDVVSLTAVETHQCELFRNRNAQAFRTLADIERQVATRNKNGIGPAADSFGQCRIHFIVIRFIYESHAAELLHSHFPHCPPVTVLPYVQCRELYIVRNHLNMPVAIGKQMLQIHTDGLVIVQQHTPGIFQLGQISVHQHDLDTQ